ncbi:WD40 repeat-like protein [Suillus decipiens]|nr:WD40 repeat-like protein [Suillus decipiens]
MTDVSIWILMNAETEPCRKIQVKDGIRDILRLPSEQRIISYSWDGSFRVWDLERGIQVGEEWKDRDRKVSGMAISPDGKKVATGGSWDGAVKLWNIDTGKVTKTLMTWHTAEVKSVCWSPDGGRVVSGSFDRTFRVWDVESGETIIGPINTGQHVHAVCYSPDARMIATGGNYGLKIWDARSGELLKTIRDRCCACLAWTSDGKTIFAGRFKIDTATWRVALNTGHRNLPYTISLSPNERILASTSYLYKTAQLWNSETDQLIGTPLHHANNVRSAIFSADGKLLVTSCNDGCLYTWDVLAIIKEAGFFDDVRDANSPPLHRRILNHMKQLSTTLNLDPDLSAGLGTYVVCYADEIDRTLSCKKSLTQRDRRLEIMTLKSSPLLARLNHILHNLT